MTLEEAGRRWVLVVAVTALWVEIAVIIVRATGPGVSASDGGRLVFTIVLCTYLLRRSNNARILAVVLYFIGALQAFLSGHALVMGLGVVYAVMSVVLWRSRGVARYFAS